MTQTTDLKHRAHMATEVDLNMVRGYQRHVWAWLEVKMVLYGDILDVGASEGYFKQLMTWEQESYTGIDISPATDHVLQATLEQFIQGSPDERYDLVIYNHVFEHLPRPGLELEMVHSVLNQDGHLFISVPLAGTDTANLDHFHLYGYSPVIMRRLLDYFKFSIVDQIQVDLRQDLLDCSPQERRTEIWTLAQKK